MVRIEKRRNYDQQWEMEIDRECFLTSRRVWVYIGLKACKILPAFHSITGLAIILFHSKYEKYEKFNRNYKHMTLLHAWTESSSMVLYMLPKDSF